MKRLLLSALVLACASPLVIAQTPEPQSICGSRDAGRFLIPIAGDVRGVKGEHFVTDITVVNFRNADQTIAFEFIPQGRTGTTPPVLITMEERTAVIFREFFERQLQIQGELGAMLITGVRVDGTPDPDAELDGFARVWHQSAAGGTLSQTVQPIRLEDWRPGSPAFVHGVEQSLTFRSNVGIINLDRNAAHRWRVLVNNVGRVITFELDVPALSMRQVPVPEGPRGGGLSVFIEPVALGSAPPTTEPWRAYATSVDNRSGSGWITPATQPRTDVIFPTEQR